jgi:hypothetical protein
VEPDPADLQVDGGCGLSWRISVEDGGSWWRMADEADDGRCSLAVASIGCILVECLLAIFR